MKLWMVQHCVRTVAYYNPTPQSDWLQSIGATFRNAASSFAASSHPQDWSIGSNDLRNLADSCSGCDDEGDDGNCGDDVDDDSCHWSLYRLGTGIGLKVLKSRRVRRCLHAGL